MPLVEKEIKIKKGVVTLTKDSAKKDDKLVFKVGYTKGEGDDKKEYVSEPIKRTLIEGEAPALTYIKGIKANKETVKPRETVTLTAEVTDQYGNPIEAGNETIRWVIKKGQDLITKTDDKPFGSVVVTNGSTFTYKAKDSGDVEIEAYIVSTAETTEPYKVTIGEIEVDELTFTPESDPLVTTNQAKEPITLGKLTVNAGAKLDPSTVKFEVTKEVTNDETGKVEKLPVEEGDVEVEAVFELNEDGEKTDNIIVQAKANKSGKYTVTPYINEDVKAENSATFTSDVKAAINKIDVKPDEEKEYKVGTPLELPIAFYNEFGELVQGDTEAQGNAKNKVTLTSSNKDIVTVELENVEKDGQETEQQQLVIKATEPGTSVITVQSGDEYKTFKVKFVQAELTTIKVADKKLEGLIANDGKAVYTDLTFFDQHEEEMNAVEEELDFKVKLGEEAAEGVTAEVVEVYTNEEGNIVEVEAETEVPEGTKTRKAVKVTADSEDSVIKPGDYTVEVSVKDNEKVEPVTFTVEVKEAREVKDIKAEPKSSTVALGSPVTVDVTVTDQYGEAFDLPGNKGITAKLIDPETEEVVEEITVNKVEGTDVKGKYTTTFTPDKGQYELVFTYEKTVGDEVVTATDKVTIHVDEAIDLIDSITFEDVKVGERVVIKDGQSLYDVKQNDEFTLVPKATDKDGKPVQLQASQLDWKSDNEELIKVDQDGKVTVVGTIGDDEEDQKVTVTATLFDVKQEITFNVSGKESKALPEKIAMTVPTGEDNQPLEVTEVTLDETATDGSIEVTYTAVDQYGENFEINLDKIDSSRTSVATAVKSADNKVKITAVDAGETTIRTTIDGNQVDLKVIVTKEAAEAAKEKAEADLKQAKDALQKALSEAELAKKDVKTSTDGSDVKPEEQWTTQEDLNTFNAAIEKAQKVYGNDKATKEELEKATADLKAAQSTYEEAKKAGTREAVELAVSEVTWVDGEKQETQEATQSTATDQNIVYTATEAGNKTYTVKLVASTEVGNDEVTETKAELSGDIITVTLAQEAGTAASVEEPTSEGTVGNVTATKADVVNAINALTEPNKVIEAQLEDNDKGTESVTATTQDIKVTGGKDSSTTGEDKAATASFTITEVGDAGTYTITLTNVAEEDVVVTVEVTEGETPTTAKDIADKIVEAVTDEASYTAEVDKDGKVTLTAKENGSKTKVEVNVTKSDE